MEKIIKVNEVILETFMTEYGHIHEIDGAEIERDLKVVTEGNTTRVENADDEREVFLTTEIVGWEKTKLAVRVNDKFTDTIRTIQVLQETEEVYIL